MVLGESKKFGVGIYKDIYLKKYNHHRASSQTSLGKGQIPSLVIEETFKNIGYGMMANRNK